MSQKEIELTTIQTEGSQESPPVNLQSETDDVDTRRSSIGDLFFKYSTKKERFLLVFGFVAAIASGIISPLGATFYGDLVNELIATPLDYSVVVKSILSYALFVFIASILAFVERINLSTFAENVTIRFRKEYTKAILRHEVEYVESISPGKLGQRFSEESSRIVTGLGPDLGMMVRSLSSVITGAVIGLVYSWQLTILLFLCFPIVLHFSKSFEDTFFEYNDLIIQEHQDADTMSEETFRNIKTVASMGAESKLAKKYDGIMDKCKDRMIKSIVHSGFKYGGMLASTNIANAFLFLTSVVVMYNQRKHFPSLLLEHGCISEPTPSVEVCFATDVFLPDSCQALCQEINYCWFHDGSKCLVGGEVLTIMLTVLNALTTFASSLVSLTTLAKSRLAAARFLEVINHMDSEDVQQAKEATFTPSSSKGDIVFTDIHFKYASRDIPILRGLSLAIHENEMLGIVGESGCGKSTILKLLMQLYSPSQGTITWDGVKTTTITRAWLRNNIAYVAQEPVLFSGTIRENIMYGRPDATEREMVEAAKLVEADAFIRKFPKGYDTHVGGLGRALSGGQKQRIAIARALLRKPRILVLDEATSALDTQSEIIVQRAIERVRQENAKTGGGLSIVVVAHRLSTIKTCDRLVVVEEGRVVEEGTHDELLKKGGIYAGLYASQASTASSAVEESGSQEADSDHTSGKEEMDASIEIQPRSASVSSSSSMHQIVVPSSRSSSLSINSTARSNSHPQEGGKLQEDIPDEVDMATTPKVGLLSMLSHIPTFRWMFWVSLVGNLIRSFFPPLYSLGSSYIQELFFSPNLQQFWHYGWMCVIVLFVATLLSYVGSVLQWNLSAIVGERLIKQLRLETFQRYLQMPVSFFDDPKHTPSILTSRLSIDGRRIRDLIDQSGIIIENFLVTFISLILCFSPLGDWRLTLVAIILSPFFFSGEYLQFMVISNTTEEIDGELIKESGIITDYLLNIHTVHAYGLEERLLKLVDRDLNHADKLTTRRTVRGAAGQCLTQIIPCLFVVGIMLAGGYMKAKGLISYTQLFVVYIAVGNAALMIGINLAYAPSAKLAYRAAKNIFGTIQLPSEDDEDRAIPPPSDISSINGDIVLSDVSFTYATRPEAPILRSVSLTIPCGKSVALVGPSGCGKSTIIALLQRFYRPDCGTITINGKPIESINLDTYREIMGAVNQEPCLFSGTIRENLQLGVDHELTDQELEHACKQALCLDFINEMPDRFETDLGATGKAISGGQKQRLALARVILRQPSILLLDEATSALDSENQERFLEALNEWRQTHPCTVITVAHRLSTIVDSDIIFVVNDGVIVANGTHEELLASCASYANLVKGQMELSPEV